MDLVTISKKLPTGLRGLTPKQAGYADARVLQHRAGKGAAKSLALGRQASADRAIARGKAYKKDFEDVYRHKRTDTYAPGTATEMRIQRMDDLGMKIPKEAEGTWWLEGHRSRRGR